CILPIAPNQSAKKGPFRSSRVCCSLAMRKPCMTPSETDDCQKSDFQSTERLESGWGSVVSAQSGVTVRTSSRAAAIILERIANLILYGNEDVTSEVCPLYCRVLSSRTRGFPQALAYQEGNQD